jgi:hypothetical protein
MADPPFGLDVVWIRSISNPVCSRPRRGFRQHGLERDDIRAPQNSVAVGRVKWAMSDILCGCSPRNVSCLRPGAQDVVEQGMTQGDFPWIAPYVKSHPVHHISESDPGVRVSHPERPPGSRRSESLSRLILQQ